MCKTLVLLIPVFKMNRRSHLGFAGSRFQEGWSGSARKIKSATRALSLAFAAYRPGKVSLPVWIPLKICEMLENVSKTCFDAQTGTTGYLIP